MNKFGAKVRKLRQEQGFTREEFCGDEADLSIRQLARIESGESLPNLDKVYYIAERLQISVGDLTDGENFDLPEHYKELKYMILRIPTYADDERLKQREDQFDEIYLTYYDNLPEEEKLVIDCMQAKLDVNITENVDFGVGLLNDYFGQIKLKKKYSLNDIVIIHLYMTCFGKMNSEKDIFNETTYNVLLDNLLKQLDLLPIEDLFLLNNVLLSAFYSAFQRKIEGRMEQIIQMSYKIMNRSQDFQKMPITCLLEWKYQLFYLNNHFEAEELYYKAVLFSKMILDSYLEKAIQSEWEKDCKLKPEEVS